MNLCLDPARIDRYGFFRVAQEHFSLSNKSLLNV